MNLFVICGRPGALKLGYRHPPVAEYPGARFTPAQLAELLADPAFVVVRGERVTVDTLAAASAEPRAAATRDPARTRHGKAV